MTTSSFVDEILPGIDEELEPGAIAKALELSMKMMPQSFPHHLWSAQTQRYAGYWYWFQGRALDVETGKTSTGETVYKFPLKINTIRTYSRIHNNMLWGETPDDHTPPVRTKIKPVKSLMDDAITEAQKTEARFYERVVNRVWEQSDARAILWEMGLVSQFLGGCYFQISYQPWHNDLSIPLVIRPLKPDFVLPIWSPDNPWELLECWIVYRMTPSAASEQYGIKHEGGTFVTYAEHWTRAKYSVWINGKPLTARYFVPGSGEVEVSYVDQRNPFGMVPVVYIPRIREGNFYGSSMVADLTGLLAELNSRMADVGDVIAKTNHRKWFGRNITQTPRVKQFDNGASFSDLGQENPAFKHPPEIWAEDPPTWSPEMNRFNEQVRSEMEREGNISPIAFGLDEGSQRSGTTLQIRMWPTISMARAQRHFWTIGLNYIAKYVLLMLAALNFDLDGKKIPKDIVRLISISQQWHPFLPRDEEQATNRIVLLTSSGQMSTERSLALQGDVDDIEEEMARIKADLDAASQRAITEKGNSESLAQPETPVATPNLSDGA